jgi:hypothetical protein
MLPRAEWEAELRFYGCKPLEGKGRLNTAELWQMPWQGWPFTVNVEDADRMHMAEMDRLRMLIVNSCPSGTKFPYNPSNPTGLKLV